MTMVIELNPEAEARLRTAAAKQGVAETEVLTQLVMEHLPSVSAEAEAAETLALFQRWRQEDANMTNEEIAEENRSWEELKADLNAERDRAGARRLF